MLSKVLFHAKCKTVFGENLQGGTPSLARNRSQPSPSPGAQWCPMSRYARLLDEDFDTTDEPSSSSALSPPPSSAFFLNNSSSNGGRCNDNNTQKMSNMIASLKESAVSASGSLRESMGKASNSVRSGLGLPPGSAVDNDTNNADESDAMTEDSGASSQVLEEISDYCPKLTYQQVRSLDVKS